MPETARTEDLFYSSQPGMARTEDIFYGDPLDETMTPFERGRAKAAEGGVRQDLMNLVDRFLGGWIGSAADTAQGLADVNAWLKKVTGLGKYYEPEYRPGGEKEGGLFGGAAEEWGAQSEYLRGRGRQGTLGDIFAGLGGAPPAIAEITALGGGLPGMVLHGGLKGYQHGGATGAVQGAIAGSLTHGTLGAIGQLPKSLQGLAALTFGGVTAQGQRAPENIWELLVGTATPEERAEGGLTWYLLGKTGGGRRVPFTEFMERYPKMDKATKTVNAKYMINKLDRSGIIEALGIDKEKYDKLKNAEDRVDYIDEYLRSTTEYRKAPEEYGFIRKVKNESGTQKVGVDPRAEYKEKGFTTNPVEVDSYIKYYSGLPLPEKWKTASRKILDALQIEPRFERLGAPDTGRSFKSYFTRKDMYLDMAKEQVKDLVKKYDFTDAEWQDLTVLVGKKKLPEDKVFRFKDAHSDMMKILDSWQAKLKKKDIPADFPDSLLARMMEEEVELNDQLKKLYQRDPGTLTRAHRDKLFHELSVKQRGAPEEAGQNIVGSQIAQVYGHVAEHTGDILHRMSQDPAFFKGSHANVKEKVDKVLFYLRDPGFEEYVFTQIQNNIQRTSEGRIDRVIEGKQKFEQKLEVLEELGRKYAKSFRNLRVYNEAQQLAKDAAIAVGEMRFKDATMFLEKLKAEVDKGERHWEQYATSYDAPGMKIRPVERIYEINQRLDEIDTARRFIEEQGVRYTPITRQMLEGLFAKDPHRTGSVMTEFFRARKTYDIEKFFKWLIEKGEIEPKDLDAKTVLASYVHNVAHKLSLADIFADAKREGMLKPKGEGEGYVGLPKREFPSLRGFEAHPEFADYLAKQLMKDSWMPPGISRTLGTIKMLQFYNPFFLPMYDVKQAFWAGTLTSRHLPKAIQKAVKDITKKTTDYWEAMYWGLASTPFAPHFEKFNEDIKALSERSVLAKQAKRQKKAPIYRMSWDAAWTMDKFIRLVTYNKYKMQGRTAKDSAYMAARIHGDYASIPPRTRVVLNKIFFTPTFKIAMMAAQTEMIRSAGKHLQYASGLRDKPSVREKHMAKALGGLLSAVALREMTFHILGFETDQFGLKYSKEYIDDEGNKREMVVHAASPDNVFLRYYHRFKSIGDEPDKVRGILNRLKWDLNPLYQFGHEMLSNQGVDFTPIWNNFDPTHKILYDMGKYTVKRLLPITSIFKGMRSEEKQKAYQALQNDLGTMAWFMDKFTLQYTRNNAEARIQWKINDLKKKFAEESKKNPPKTERELEERIEKFENLLRGELEKLESKSYDSPYRENPRGKKGTAKTEDIFY